MDLDITGTVFVKFKRHFEDTLRTIIKQKQSTNQLTIINLGAML